MWGLPTRFSLALAMMLAQAVSAETLSWNEALTIVSEQNSDLLAAKAALKASEFDIRAAHSGLFPQISASGGATYGSDALSLSVGVAARQALLSWVGDSARIDQSRASKKAREADLKIAAARASYDLKFAFANMALSQDRIELAKDIIERRQANYRLVSLRFEGGRENKGSALLSKAYLEQAQLELLQAKNALLISKTQLANVLGINQYALLSVTGRVPIAEPPVQVQLDDLAYQTPAYQLASAAKERAEAAYAIAWSNFVPSLDLVARGGGLSKGQEMTPNWLVGAELNLSIFSGGRDYYATKSASGSQFVAKYQQTNTFLNSMVQLETTYSAFVESVQKLKADHAFVEAVSVRAKIAREKYNNGLLSFEDWDIIENDLISRQKSFLQSQRDRVVAQAQWEQAQGISVIP